LRMKATKLFHTTTVLLATVHSITDRQMDIGQTDDKLSLSVQLCQSGFYHLCQLYPVLRSLVQEAAKTLIQAFISSCLDYCNSLLYGLTHSLIRKIQSVQNAATQLLTGTR